MTQNTDPQSVSNAILAALAGEVNTVSQRLEASQRDVGELAKRLSKLIKTAQIAPVTALSKPTEPDLHPVAKDILSALTKAGVAVRKTVLAKQLKVERATIHYHGKTLTTKGLVYGIETRDDSGRDVDYLILCPLLKIPGIDKTQPASQKQSG